MPLSITPQLKESNEALAFLTKRVSTDFVLVEDEHNPRISYVIKQNQAVGFHYEKQFKRDFDHHILRLRKLREFAAMCPAKNILGEYIWWATFHETLWEFGMRPIMS